MLLDYKIGDKVYVDFLHCTATVTEVEKEKQFAGTNIEFEIVYCTVEFDKLYLRTINTTKGKIYLDERAPFSKARVRSEYLKPIDDGQRKD